MIGKLIYVDNNEAHIQLEKSSLTTDLLNHYLVIENDKQRVLGEIENITKEQIHLNLLGEFTKGGFISGVIRKPNLTDRIRSITKEELEIIVGQDDNRTLLIGRSPLYNYYPIFVDVNTLFSQHMVVLGSTGSGKSWGVARLLQNVLQNPHVPPIRSNFFLFDSYGEYHHAFESIEQYNPHFHFKYYSTNKGTLETNRLQIPLWLLDLDDFALLLDATEHNQLSMIETMIRMVRIFAEPNEKAKHYKNHLLASAILTILYTNETAFSKRNDIFTILKECHTEEFHIHAIIQGVGYQRTFRECLTIDRDGEFQDRILINEYIESFIDDQLNQYEPSSCYPFTLKDLEKAFQFTLISEGFIHNREAYNDAVRLKVRLHMLSISQDGLYFSYPTFVTLDQYIAHLLSLPNGEKAQIVNFNLEDIDDRMAKVITKVMTKFLFTYTKKLSVRASFPFHIVLEEAHRYVQNDQDNFLFGYNIFERVAKEGRKYGLMLNLISQRPVDLSDTVIAQCSNFLIFKLTHPLDLDYISRMLPNISKDIIEKQKNLQPGTCIGFGRAFPVPMIIHMDYPNPVPESSNSNIIESWQNKTDL